MKKAWHLPSNLRFLILLSVFLLIAAVNAHSAKRPIAPADSIESMSEDKAADVVQLLYGERNKYETTGSVSFIEGNRISDIDGTYRLNSVSGLVPGLYILQNNGMPGDENARVYIRGQNGFGISGSQALILVDGFETDLIHINPYDIESITVLKDAVSTAMYGMRASNGVILINTRRGRQGDIRINMHSTASLIKPLKVPEFLGSADYARLYNEAVGNEGGILPYSQEDIDNFDAGSDPVLYPDIDFYDEFYKPYSLQVRNTFDVSGGSEKAGFLFLASYLNHNGIYHTATEENPYETNDQLSFTDIHANLNFKVGEKLSINFDMKTKLDQERVPGSYTGTRIEDLIGIWYGTPPLAYPVFNPDSSLGGTNDFRQNYYGELNRSGYSLINRTYMLGILDFSYNLDDFINGLSLVGKFGYRSVNTHIINRSKTYAVFELTGELDSTTMEPVYNKIGENTSMQSVSNFAGDNRYYNGELGLRFDRSFTNGRLGSVLLADQQYYRPSNNLLPNVYRGLKLGVFYNSRNKYLFDLALAYNGNNQFPSDNRYGFFPAAGIGWILSNEDFFSGVERIDLLKFRFSGGITGNTFNPYSLNAPYFNYLPNYELTTNGYVFGTNTGTYYQGFEQTQVPNPAITWEECQKLNAGIDMSMAGHRFSISADFFYEKNYNILVENASSGLLGASFWYPVGIVGNRGVELEVTWNDGIGDLKYFIQANTSYIKNKIIDQKEQERAYEWMRRTGNPVGTQFGYVFDRYFTEEDDFSALPDQSLLGSVMPGDLKYVDLNEDNKIDENDQRAIGKSTVPEWYFGVNTGVEIKGFSLNILLQGMANAEQYFSGGLVHEFIGGKGNVNSSHLERWQPGDGQDAGYPRLGIQNVSNNRVKSDYWIRNVSFLRIKTARLGYSFDDSFVKQLSWLRSFNIYLSGYNLLTLTRIKGMDPETDTKGEHYPISSYYTLGVNIGF